MTCLHQDENVVHTNSQNKEGYDFDDDECCWFPNIAPETQRRKHWECYYRNATYTQRNLGINLEIEKSFIFNFFTPEGFPIDEQNRLASDRVKSISATHRSERVNARASVQLIFISQDQAHVNQLLEALSHFFFLSSISLS